ncbi:MAG: hypothetical protein LBI10_10835, partial [Deltaproteobacteria bacterium]|nr:hypothetical protein [Deltaproteobacteria bacterium]
MAIKNSGELLTPVYDSVRRIGAAFLFGQSLSRLGLSDLLDQIFGLKRARQIRTAALYMTIKGNDLAGLDDF